MAAQSYLRSPAVWFGPLSHNQACVVSRTMTLSLGMSTRR